MKQLRQGARQGLAQLQSNRILRWGLIAVVVLLWSEGLVRLDEYSQRLLDEGRLVRSDLARLQALQRERAWPARLDDARRLLDLQERMLWQAPSAGLAEASLQDWLRSVCAKAGINVKNLQVSRTVAAAAPTMAASTPAELAAVRAQLVGEFRRLPVLGLLQEVALHERNLVVDRVLLMPAAQPPLFELELRAPTALTVAGGANVPAAKAP